MKRVILVKKVILALVPIAGLVLACIGVGGAAAEPITIAVGYASGATGPHAAGARGFEEELERLAPGRFKVEQFPGGALGGEREMAEGVQLGSLEMAIIGTAVIGNFVPEMMVADLPFLFRSYDHARAVMDGPVGEELLDKFRTADIVGLAFGEVGLRHLTNDRRPIRSVEDLKGLKIRTMENPVHLDAFRTLGALPTPMSWTEVVTALQQGTVDGQENPMSILISTKLWETQRYATLSSHAFTPVAFIMSPTFFDSLSPEDQEIVREAAKAGSAANRRYVDEMEQRGVEELESHGMEVVTDLDTAEFEQAMAPIYEKYGDQFGDLVDRIRSQGQ